MSADAKSTIHLSRQFQDQFKSYLRKQAKHSDSILGKTSITIRHKEQIQFIAAHIAITTYPAITIKRELLRS